MLGTSVSTRPLIRGVGFGFTALSPPPVVSAGRSPRSRSACSNAPHSAAAVDIDSPTATTDSYPAAAATKAKSPPCAWNPSRSLSASASGSSDPRRDSASRLSAAFSASIAVAIHRDGAVWRPSSATPPPRLPNTADGISGWSSLRSHGTLRMSQWRPCPATTPMALREARSMAGPDAPALHRTSRDATDGPPKDTGCHGSPRGAPVSSASSTGAVLAGADANSRAGSACTSPGVPPSLASLSFSATSRANPWGSSFPCGARPMPPPSTLTFPTTQDPPPVLAARSTVPSSTVATPAHTFNHAESLFLGARGIRALCSYFGEPGMMPVRRRPSLHNGGRVTPLHHLIDGHGNFLGRSKKGDIFLQRCACLHSGKKLTLKRTIPNCLAVRTE